MLVRTGLMTPQELLEMSTPEEFENEVRAVEAVPEADEEE